MKISTLFLSALLAVSVCQAAHAGKPDEYREEAQGQAELKESHRSFARKLGLTAVTSVICAVAAERFELPIAVKNAATFLALASWVTFVVYDNYLVDCYDEDYLF